MCFVLKEERKQKDILIVWEWDVVLFLYPRCYAAAGRGATDAMLAYTHYFSYMIVYTGSQ